MGLLLGSILSPTLLDSALAMACPHNEHVPQENEIISPKLSEKDKSYAVLLYGNEVRTESRIHDWI